MAREFLGVSDGTFTLSETENTNQFYFYRNDGKVLTDIGREPMNLYEIYIMKKMMDGEITDKVMNNIYTEMSDDERCIRLTIEEKMVGSNNSIVIDKHPNFIKRLLNKIFG